jgi:putative peptidoglycan lipid II flippase
MIDAQGGYLHRWNTWRSISVNREILSATLAVGGMTAVVHIATAARDIILAYQFGTTDVLDAFLIAILLPSVAISIVAGSFASAFIPTYISVQLLEGHEAAKRVYQSLMIGTLILLTGLVTVLALTAPVIVPFLGSGFSPEKLAFTRSLLLMLLPVLVLKGVAAVWTAVLNASERFSVAAGIPILTPAMTIALLLVMGHLWGIYSLVIGTVGGAFVETAVLVWHLRRLGIPIIPHWSGWSPPIAEVTRQYGPMLAGAFLMSSTLLVDQAMAAMLGPGSVSTLNFGSKVVSFLLAVAATGLGTAVLPHFSRMVAQSDWLGVRHTLRTYVRLILLTTVPLTLLCIYLSEWLVQVIFERGAFTMADTQVVSQVQAFLLLQIPLYLVGILIVRLVSALKANWVLMWGCVINFVVNVVLNYVLMQWLQVAGIALSTSLVYLVSVIYLSIMLERVLKQCEIQEAVQLKLAQMAG